MSGTKSLGMLFRKKKIIILAICIGIPVVIAILSVAMQSTPSRQGTPTPMRSSITQHDGTSGNIKPTNVSVTIGVKNRIPEWKIYEGSNYTISVPPEWSVDKQPIEGGGEAVTIKPNVLPDGINYPRFIFESSPSVNTLQQKIGLLKLLEFKESETTVAGKSAIKLSGTVSYKMVAGQKVDEPVQKTFVFLTQKDRLYVFRYEYEGSKTYDPLEAYFTDLIDSIRIK